MAAVAAAAAVVAVGASALHVTKRPNPAAVVVGDTGTVGPTATPTAPTGPAAPSAPHIQLSTTDYTATTLAAQARALLDDPATPLRDLAAESPALGPIATPVGLASCLDALGESGPARCRPTSATFEGRPAAIIVVTDGGHEHGVCRRAQLLPRQRHRCWRAPHAQVALTAGIPRGSVRARPRP